MPFRRRLLRESAECGNARLTFQINVVLARLCTYTSKQKKPTKKRPEKLKSAMRETRGKGERKRERENLPRDLLDPRNECVRAR